MIYYFTGLVYYSIMFNVVLQNGEGIGLIRLLEVWFFSTVIPDGIISRTGCAGVSETGPSGKEII